MEDENMDARGSDDESYSIDADAADDVEPQHSIHDNDLDDQYWKVNQSEKEDSLTQPTKDYCDLSICGCDDKDLCLHSSFDQLSFSTESLKCSICENVCSYQDVEVGLFPEEEVDKDEEICKEDNCTCPDKETCPHKMEKVSKLKKRELCTCDEEICVCGHKEICPHEKEESVANIEYLAISFKVESATSVQKTQKRTSKKDVEKGGPKEREMIAIEVVLEEGYIRKIVSEEQTKMESLTDKGDSSPEEPSMQFEDIKIRKKHSDSTSLFELDKEIITSGLEREMMEKISDVQVISEEALMKFLSPQEKLKQEKAEEAQEKEKSKESQEKEKAAEAQADDSFLGSLEEEKHSIDSDEKSIESVGDSSIGEKPFVEEFVKKPVKKICTDVCTELENDIILEEILFGQSSTDILTLEEEEFEGERIFERLIKLSEDELDLEDIESNYAPPSSSDVVENARYHKIRKFAEILLNETFRKAQEIVQLKKEGLNQRLLALLIKKEEAKREQELSQAVDEEETEPEITWPTNGNFNIYLGYRCIEEWISYWERMPAWRYCVELIDERTDHSTDFYLYQSTWSLPTPETPVPIATASVFFEYRVSRIKPKSYPVEVFYQFEYSRFKHHPGKTRFKEKWLFDILRIKEKVFDSLRF